jgi:hypothetical protein
MKKNSRKKPREKGLRENKNKKETKLIKIVNNDKNSKQ